jgi:hypothetical protein
LSFRLSIIHFDNTLVASNKRQEVIVAHLTALKVVASPIMHNKSAEQLRRNKLISKLQEQLALVEAELNGTSYKRMRSVVVANEEGEPIRVQRPVRLKQWWTKTPAGQVLLTVRYGAVALPIANGMTAIDVGQLTELPKTLATVIKAVDEGELDAELAAVAKERHFGKRASEKKPSPKK